MLARLRTDRRKINIASILLLTIMFRLGLGFAHAGAVLDVVQPADEANDSLRGGYCGPGSENNSVHLIEMLCPLCHAISSEDDQDMDSLARFAASGAVILATNPRNAFLTAVYRVSVNRYFNSRAPPSDFPDQRTG
ncbi:MAG: hypothetical protein P8Y12_01470 [Gammaproteobacteria bacterium]